MKTKHWNATGKWIERWDRAINDAQVQHRSSNASLQSEEPESMTVHIHIDALTSLLTALYHEENDRINDKFDRTATELLETNPALFQCSPACTLPHERLFLEESSAAMARYKSDMRALAGICGRLGLTPNKILRRFAPQG